MKDMTVEELLTRLEYPYTHSFKEKIDTKAELLRRYEELKCCGNCKNLERGHEDLYCIITGDEITANYICHQWQFRWREEREGK